MLNGRRKTECFIVNIVGGNSVCVAGSNLANNEDTVCCEDGESLPKID